MTDKKVIYAAVAIAVVAVAAIGVFLLLDSNKETPVGTFAEYDVSGSYGATTFDGTVKITIVSETSKKYKIETVYNVYETTGGVRSPMMVMTETAWENKSAAGGQDFGVKQGTPETLTTAWGPKTVDKYVSAVPGEPTATTYVGQTDGVPYKMVVVVDLVTLTFTLTDTNLL